jgi:general secretion pathway protein C
MSNALTDSLIRHRHARAIALAAVAACGALLALALARVVLLLLSLGAPQVPPVQAMSVEQLVRSAESGTASIASWHLFGNALPLADPRGVAAAPDTGLQLILMGVFAGDDPKDGRAIIADGAGGEQHYMVGQEVVPGVTLDGVYPDRVTLSRGGAIEALRLPRPSATGASPGGDGIVVQNRPLPPGMAGTSPTAPLPGTPAPAAPFVQPLVSMGGIDWNAATAKLGVDAQQLAREVTALPVMEGGRFVGVRLQAGRDSPLARLGLQPGDVVTAVNGIELDSPARAAEVANTLSTARAANVTVRRNGKSEQISVKLQ